MKLFLWIVLFVTLFLFSIRYVERHSLYFPMKEVGADPGVLGLPYEEIYFRAPDGKRLNGWYIPRANAAFTVILSHGNAGNIGHRLQKISMLNELGLAVLIFDYRGYGRSEGAPSEAGLYEDLKGAFDYLTRERGVSADAIILYGESLGGGVAIEVARREAIVAALITEEAFTSVKDMAAMAYPSLPHFIFSSRFDSVSKIGAVRCPKLIIHSVDDEIVPFHLGERLFEAAGPPKKFLKLRGGHNTAFLDSKEQFREGIKSFLDDLKRQ